MRLYLSWLATFTFGLSIGLLVRLPSKSAADLEARRLARERVAVEKARQDFRTDPSYRSARTLALHLSALRSAERHAQDEGVSIPEPTTRSEALEAAAVCRDYAGTEVEVAEALRVMGRAEQLGERW